MSKNWPMVHERSPRWIDTFHFVSLIFLASTGMSGCGQRSNLPPLVEVSGTVMLDNGPLANAEVLFIPKDSTPGPGASGRTDAQGRYVLRTENVGQGTPAGEYRVTIHKFGVAAAAGQSGRTAPAHNPFEETLPDRYSSRRDTELHATVGGSANTCDFQLVCAKQPSK